MQWFEETALDTFPYEITLWKRYVNDTIAVLMDELLEDFTTHINAIHPAIRFTREKEKAEVIALLDAKILKKEDRSSFSVYRKPTHTDHYLQFGSNQPLQHKLGVIRTLVHHSSTICSDRDEQALEIQHLKRVLSVSGYTKKAWRIATRARPRNASPSTQPSERVKNGVSLSPMSDRLQRRLPASFVTGA